MSFGKGGGSSQQAQTTTPTLSEEQKASIRANTEFLTGTIIPTYKGAVEGATEVYNVNAPSVLQAAQNQAQQAAQAQEVLGSTGESALRTGITGLQQAFDPAYERTMIQAALAPGQAQYEANIADQAARFGGAGTLGSARQALADRQLASSNQAAQFQTAAQVQQGIANQRMDAASQLAGYGQGGIGQALGAAGSGVSAAMTPQQLYNQYASVIFGTPAASYKADFRGTQGSQVDKSGRESNWNAKVAFM